MLAVSSNIKTNHKTTTNGLVQGWREKALSRGPTTNTPSSNTSRFTTPSTPNTKTPSVSGWKQRFQDASTPTLSAASDAGITHKRSTCMRRDSEEEIGGLDDADVTVRKPKAGIYATQTRKEQLKARQQMYAWHRGFIESALKAVKASITDRFGANPAASTIKNFVAKAIAPGGEAFCGPVMNKSTLEPFHSPFVLKCMAQHLTAMQGTLFTEQKYPVGALALSLISVQLVFNMYASGKMVAHDGFTNENAGPLTSEYTCGSDFARLLDKHHQFDEILKAAFEYADEPKNKRQAKNLGLQTVSLTISSSPAGSPSK
ncbi:hypothetical protein BJ138DRAFT_1119700 [Hygrophoropsis aurantiaca]|uniref:Uncharacterized protein n=1 Tax=Hygrophoropsis aurantiaca TaxID=72124 RepID=A0ACB7ZTS2_9AGAM|nr:hypothetical protein BJ138DRAFT_1119700 [Hygrophoropsis aurantiaca]